MTPARRPPYLPFLNGPLSLAPGLRPIDPANWLLPDTEAHILDEKRTLMKARRGEVFASTLGEHEMEEAASIVSRGRGPLPHDFETPLERAAAMQSDDLCLLKRDQEGLWRLRAASLCAPTFWRLSEKIGEPLSGLHHPVPGANPGMVSRIHRMFDALRPDQVLERFNWTVQPGPERFMPDQAPFKRLAAELPEEGVLEAMWLRVERQTIRKTPAGTMIFTIRVALDPLSAALADAAHAAAFRAAWDGTGPVLADYKGWPHYQRLVRAALAQAGISS